VTDLLTMANSVPGYFLLGLVAFCDTLIGVGFFVFGEAAFLASGALWTSTGQAWPVAMVFCLSWAGDLTSFALGRRFGRRFSLRYLKRLKRRRAWRGAQSALHRKGGAFVIVSRLLGPTAWVTPFLAGTMGMATPIFAAASAIGIILGVGQFVLLGALGYQSLPYITSLLSDHIWTIALGLTLLLSAIFVWRRSEASCAMRALKVVIVAAVVFGASNLLYFFALNPHPVAASPALSTRSVCDLANRPLLAHPGHTDWHLPQPVNVVLLSGRRGSDLMSALGWHQNLTFSQNAISFVDFLRQLARQTPPVSELLFDGRPANSAFQMSGTIKKREHIRWWDVGPDFSVGAISRDDELAIKYYRHLPVLLHDIDPRVDLSRDMLRSQVIENNRFDVLGFASLAQEVPDGVEADYQTDGRVLVIVDRDADIPPDTLSCLKITPLT